MSNFNCPCGQFVTGAAPGDTECDACVASGLWTSETGQALKALSRRLQLYSNSTPFADLARALKALEARVEAVEKRQPTVVNHHHAPVPAGHWSMPAWMAGKKGE